MVTVGSNLNELVGKLGTAPQQIDAKVGDLSNSSLAMLKSLGASFNSAALTSTNKFGQEIQDTRAPDLPPFGHNPTPKRARAALQRYTDRTYYTGQKVEMHPTRKNLFNRLLHKRRSHGMKMVRLLFKNPSVRAGFEREIAGNVVRDLRADGKITVQQRSNASVSGQTSGASVSAMTSGQSSNSSYGMGNSNDLYSCLMQMDAAVTSAAANLSMSQSSYDSPNSGFSSSSMLGKGGLGGVSSYGMSIDDAYGIADITDGDADDAASVDTETLRLKRMLDKREQMYNLIKGVWDKYNQSAKATIDNMRG